MAREITRASAGVVPRYGPIHVAVNRHEYVGRGCPIEIVFTGSINLEPHDRGLVFNYHWERSDGAKSATKVVRPGPHEIAEGQVVFRVDDVVDLSDAVVAVVVADV